MRHRLFLFSTAAGLALALAIGIEAALAGRAEAQDVTLTVSVTGTGTGKVWSSNAVAISCPRICSAQVTPGTSVDLHVKAAVPTATVWTTHGGVCTHPSPSIKKPWIGCTVTLNGDTSIKFTFTLVACAVPNVKAESLATAKRTIRSHGCSVGAITHDTSRTVKKGHVISQTPTPSTKTRRKGAKINLAISAGTS